MLYVCRWHVSGESLQNLQKKHRKKRSSGNLITVVLENGGFKKGRQKHWYKQNKMETGFEPSGASRANEEFIIMFVLKISYTSWIEWSNIFSWAKQFFFLWAIQASHHTPDIAMGDISNRAHQSVFCTYTSFIQLGKNCTLLCHNSKYLHTVYWPSRRETMRAFI